MNKGDVLCAALAEITGYPGQLVNQCVGVWKDNFGGPHELDTEISVAAADDLLADIIADRVRISGWLLKYGIFQETSSVSSCDDR